MFGYFLKILFIVFVIEKQIFPQYLHNRYKILSLHKWEGYQEMKDIYQTEHDPKYILPIT